MAQDFTDWIDKIDTAIIDQDFELNDWESEFYESIKNQLDEGYPLSVKQINCLEKIYTKVTEGKTYR